MNFVEVRKHQNFFGLVFLLKFLSEGFQTFLKFLQEVLLGVKTSLDATSHHAL